MGAVGASSGISADAKGHSTCQCLRALICGLPCPMLSRSGMRVAALDVGEARIGVAVSDELGITAQGIGVVRRVGGRRDLEALATLLAPYQPTQLVVGLPLELSGAAGPE